MQAAEIKIDASKIILDSLTIKVTLTGLNVLKARILIGKIFLYVGAKIIGCKIEIV